MSLFEFFQEQFLGQVLSYVLPLIVVAILGWLATLYARVTGKELEAKHREALQLALTNGLNWAIQQVLNGKLGKDGTVPPAQKDAVVAKAQEYVTTSVPDAVKHFQITPSTMDKLVTAKLPTSAPAKSLVE
jgi:hypothetical protein